MNEYGYLYREMFSNSLNFLIKNFSSILIELFPYTPVPSGWYSTIKSFSNIK